MYTHSAHMISIKTLYPEYPERRISRTSRVSEIRLNLSAAIPPPVRQSARESTSRIRVPVSYIASLGVYKYPSRIQVRRLYYIILYYTILYYNILFYTILYYTILCYAILYVSYSRLPSRILPVALQVGDTETGLGATERRNV